MTATMRDQSLRRSRACIITLLSLGALIASAAPATAMNAPPGTRTQHPNHVLSRPASASGCTNNTVCVFVEGDGLHVDSLGGGVSVPGSIINNRKWCGKVGLTVTKSGNTYFADSSPHACATASTPYDYTNYANRSFPDGSRACAYAHTDSGYYNPGSSPACETITT